MVKLEAMAREALAQELETLRQSYEAYRAKQLKLDMSRGKPAPDQLDLSMGLLTETTYKDETGIDARNYGNLEGMPE
ncbi:MAG: aminotransferase, partial [Ruthenibacterium sp.]